MTATALAAKRDLRTEAAGWSQDLEAAVIPYNEGPNKLFLLNLSKWLTEFSQSPEASRPAQNIVAERQIIDNAHADIYFVWNTFGDKLPPMALNHLEAAMKTLAAILSPTKNTAPTEAEI